MTTSYLKAIMGVYGETVTGLGLLDPKYLSIYLSSVTQAIIYDHYLRCFIEF